MPLINDTYFHTELHVAGIANTADGGSQKLDRFIAKYEPLFLKQLLGVELYADLLVGITASTPKYIALRGVIVDSANKISPIANYVYYWYSRNAVTESTQVGEVKGVAENSVNASSIEKQVKAWNDMVDMNDIVLQFISNNIADYPTFLDGGNFKPINSLNL